MSEPAKRIQSGGTVRETPTRYKEKETDRYAQGEGKRQQRRRTEAPKINKGRDSGTKKKTQSWSWGDTALASELWGAGRRWQVRICRRDPKGLVSSGVTKAPRQGKAG